MRHLVANLWLLVLSLALCSVVYPLILLAVGHLPFLKDKAEGSLITNEMGDVIGSRLEAQAFEGEEYFWPRPSYGSYNAAASGGSNLSANNPELRRRVENQLGTLLKYGPKGARPGKMIGPDIEKWFAEQKGIVAQWAEDNPGLAQSWVKGSKDITAFIESEKEKSLSNHIDAWKKANKKEASAISSFKADELAVPFFKYFSEKHPIGWPAIKEGKPTTVTTGKDIRGFFYPLWRKAYPNEDLAPVPADMVTTSGSGLDPHITMKAAHYQLDRVADALVRKGTASREAVVDRMKLLLQKHRYAPLGGLAGVDMVNVLDVNLAIKNGDW